MCTVSVHVFQTYMSTVSVRVLQCRLFLQCGDGAVYSVSPCVTMRAFSLSSVWRHSCVHCQSMCFKHICLLCQSMCYSAGFSLSSVWRHSKLQALVYDSLPSTTVVFSYAIGSRKLSANEQFFVGAQTVVRFLQTTQIMSDICFITDQIAYASSNKTKII